MTRGVANFMHRLLPDFYFGEDSMDSGPIGDPDSEDGRPLPLDSTRPACDACGGPNYSPTKNICIACRLFLQPL